MSFDLCIPAYNEAPIIGESLREVSAALEAAGLLETRIIVVDNASTDETAEAARATGIKNVVVLTTRARGKGNAIRAAAGISISTYFGFIDADLSANPADIKSLLALVEDGVTDIAIGSRLLDPGSVRRSFFRSFSSWIFNALRRALLGIHVADSQCGLKIMNARARNLLATCREEGWFLDLEFLRRAEKSGCSIREVPVRWDEYRYKDRKAKLRVLRDGIGAVVAMVRIRIQNL